MEVPTQRESAPPGTNRQGASQKIIAATTTRYDEGQGTRPGYRSPSAPIQPAQVLAQDQRRRHLMAIVQCGCGRTHVHRALGLRRGACGREYRVVAA